MTSGQTYFTETYMENFNVWPVTDTSMGQTTNNYSVVIMPNTILLPKTGFKCSVVLKKWDPYNNKAKVRFFSNKL